MIILCFGGREGGWVIYQQPQGVILNWSWSLVTTLSNKQICLVEIRMLVESWVMKWKYLKTTFPRCKLTTFTKPNFTWCIKSVKIYWAELKCKNENILLRLKQIMSRWSEGWTRTRNTSWAVRSSQRRRSPRRGSGRERLSTWSNGKDGARGWSNCETKIDGGNN